MALTKVSRGLLSTGIVDNSNATAITLNADESATFAGNVGIGGSTITDVNLLNIQGSGASKNIGVVFNDTNTSKIFAIQNGGSALKFFDYTASAERMRIDGGTGNLLVGTTTTNIATEGTVIYGAGNEGVMTLSSTNMTALYVNRSTYGELVQFRQGGSTVVGSIGSFNGVPYIGYAGGAGGGIMFNGASIEPTALGASRTDGANDIGSVNYRWKDLYLSGGVYLGGAGAANKLDDYETGTWTPAVTTSSGSISYAAQQAAYVKVGNVVHYWIRLVATCTATATLYNLSLPFPTSGYNNFYAGPTVGNAYNVTLGSGGTVLGGYYIHATNAIRMHAYGNNTGQLSPSVTANTAFEFRMEGSYRLAA